jgi:hypothetical protein
MKYGLTFIFILLAACVHPDVVQHTLALEIKDYPPEHWAQLLWCSRHALFDAHDCPI